MKTLKRQLHFASLLVMVVLFSFCSKDDKIDELFTENIIDTSTETETTTIGSNSNTILTATSDHIEETSNGYSFEGTLGAKSDNGESYPVIDGNISVETGDDGEITGITGEGSVNFPNIGNFKSILKDFDWKEAVKSHIEYKKGSEYKSENNTDLPLNDETRYMHFQVFDEEKGDRFELKSKLNDKVYDFADFYLDPNDPAIFLKMELSKPTKAVKKINNSKITKKLMDKIRSKATQESIDELADVFEPGSFSIGMSNQGKINSRYYEFSKPENFLELYGFSGFESHTAHLYERLENIPIPETFILRFSGEGFIHYPVEQFGPDGLLNDKNDWSSWFNELEPDNLNYSFTGSIDMGGKGIGMILGALPKMNDILGHEIFGEEINLDLLAATEQVSIALLDDSSILGDNSWRFGGEVRTPVIGDIFGEKLSKYIFQPPSLTCFLYLSLGTELEDWSLYLQGDTILKLSIVFEAEYSSYFTLNKDGIKTKGYLKEALGPMEFTNVVTGSIGPDDGLELTTLCDKEIELPNGIVLQNTHLETSLSTRNGIQFEGTMNLPFGIVDADTKGELGPDGISMTGSFSSDITLPNGTKISTFGAGLEFGISTNPEDGISLSGFIDAPAGIGSVAVEGYMKSGELYLHGNFDGNVDFKGVNLYTANGEITISSTEGFKVNGGFDLPMTKANLSGYITNEGIELDGSVTKGLTVAGHEFSLSSSHVHASSATGVQISGNMNLYFVSTNVSGSINPDNSFSLSGSVNKNLGPWESNIKTTVTQSGVSLSGSGCLDVPFLGRQCQSLSFQPNWAAKTVKVCRGSICYTF